jgi:hypothetical protein
VLVIVDAAAGAYDLTGLDDNKRSDVERFAALWVRPFWKAGIATNLIDHVVKNPEQRGKYAIGSERKAGGVDVHLGFDVIPGHELTRGGNGLYKLTTHKDRPARLTRPIACELELHSDPDSGRITWATKPAGTDGEGRPFWPTTLMERISRYLEIQRPEPVSRNTVEQSVKGKTEWKRVAIDTLVSQGYVQETSGDRNARLLLSVKAFREADLAPDLAPEDKDDLAPDLAPDKPLNHAENATSPHLAPTSPLVPDTTSPPSPLSPTGERDGRGEVEQPPKNALYGQDGPRARAREQAGDDPDAEARRAAEAARDFDFAHPPRRRWGVELEPEFQASIESAIVEIEAELDRELAELADVEPAPLDEIPEEAT